MVRTSAHFTLCSRFFPKTLRNGTLRSVPLRRQNACKCQCSFSLILDNASVRPQCCPMRSCTRRCGSDAVISHTAFFVGLRSVKFLHRQFRQGQPQRLHRNRPKQKRQNVFPLIISPSALSWCCHLVNINTNYY